MKTIPVEFVEWSGFGFGPLREGETTALDNQEVRFAITRSGGTFQVSRSSRGGEPDSSSAFWHELDAVRHLMLILGGDGRSIHTLARLRVPPEFPAVEAILVDETEEGSVRLSWDEGGERHRGTFRKGALGQTDARKLAQCIGSTIPELADSLRSADGGPFFHTVEPA